MTFGIDKPLWPLPLAPKQWTAGGSFAAKRPSSATFTRHHQGVDLYAPEGTPVLACEDGVVVADQGWDGPGTRAVLVESVATGVLLLYGAVAPGSYPAKGIKVKRGQQIAKIGVYPHGSTMLHGEAWVLGVRPPRPQWRKDDPRPPELLDISEYLERAKASYVDQAPAQSEQTKKICGADVTASTDPFLDPLRGDLTYDHPCSVILGVEVCQPTNVTAWRASLTRELDITIPSYNAFNKKVGEKIVVWDGPTSKAYDQMMGGKQALSEWNEVNSLPWNAVEALKKAAAEVRCAGKLFAERLAKLQPDNAPENEDSGGSNGGGSKPSQGGGQQNTPTPSKGGGGTGLALAAAGAAFFLLK